MNKELPTYELVLGDNDQIELVSLVKDPAIDELFMKFNKEEQLKLFFAEDEKQIITGPALIPDKLIYRIHPQTKEEFNCFFTAETINQISQRYLIEANQSNVNLEHEKKVLDVCMIESWIIEDSKTDKAYALGMELPKGTWMCSMKVNNKEVWQQIKSGDLAGFSVEGTLSLMMSKTEPVESEEDILIRDCAAFVKEINEALESMNL